MSTKLWTPSNTPETQQQVGALHEITDQVSVSRSMYGLNGNIRHKRGQREGLTQCQIKGLITLCGCVTKQVEAGISGC